MLLGAPTRILLFPFQGRHFGLQKVSYLFPFIPVKSTYLFSACRLPPRAGLTCRPFPLLSMDKGRYSLYPYASTPIHLDIWKKMGKQNSFSLA